MKLAFAVLGAGALALISGAAAGSAVNTDPVSRADSAAPSFAAKHPQPAFDAKVAKGPDHYPLETPRGVVPVSELAWHGVMRGEYRPYGDARTSEAVYYRSDYDPARKYPEEDGWAPSRFNETREAEYGQGNAVIVEPAPAEPLRNVALNERREGARVIDVAKELARYR